MESLRVCWIDPMLSSPERSGPPASKAARFGTTQWSIVLKAGQGAEAALLRLCQIYWPPLYTFIRRRGHAVHEAQDFTQTVFSHLLQNDSPITVTHPNGRFRSVRLITGKHV